MSGSLNVLVCGATGFIGRNVLEQLRTSPQYRLHAVYHHQRPPAELAEVQGIRFIQADLTNAMEVSRIMEGMDIVVLAAATTSGAKDIIQRPYIHIADNAVMNSLLFRACHEHGVRHVVFFSCTVMYSPSKTPVKEEDFRYDVSEKYFGGGWTKVYLEKMCEFYSRQGPTKYTAIRHSNIYGPYDHFDLEKSHVFAATVTKVMTAKASKVTVWGDGSEARDFLYVGDLMRFVQLALVKQSCPFDLVNVGFGKAISVRDLVTKVIERSGRKLGIEFDRTKPTIPFTLALDCGKAWQRYGWKPEVSLADGIDKTLKWYEANHLASIGSNSPE